jgi:uroporphyrinogen III methyltransferase/synthase
MNGRVYLIGAGPGDPGLLTLRGAELLGRAHVVLYDGLSNPELLSYAPAAEHICVGKHGQTRIWRQEEIIQEILRHARAGKEVARLKGGDPAVFARTAEEVEAVAAAGIPLEIVPGITAALAASSYAGIPVTHRRFASAVALVTGHEEPNKPESSLDWEALAMFPGTLVIYMGVTTAAHWTRRLIEGGKHPETPAAIIRRCSLPDQRTIRCSLQEVPRQLTPSSRIRPPVIVIIGEVARMGASTNWFPHRPLAGQTILVTRPLDQAESMAGPLRELGAHVLLQPAIEIGPPEDWTAVDSVIDRIRTWHYLIFCSRNGVHHFLGRMWQRGYDARHLAGVSIGAVGSKTASELEHFQIHPDIVPTEFRAESLAAELAGSIAGKRVLIVRASRGRDVLADSLSQSGAEVRQVIAYQHSDATEVDPDVLELAQQGRIDWITVTSSESANCLNRLFGPAMKQMKIATISPITSESVRELGLTVSAEADPHTVPSLIESIVKASQ